MRCHNNKIKSKKMKCKEVENNLIFLIEGDLDEKKMSDIKAHLNNCNNCMELYEKMNSDFLLLNNEKITKTNPFFYARLVEQVNQKENNQDSIIRLKARQFYTQAAVYAAAVVLAIFLGVGLGSDLNTNNEIVIDYYEETTDYQMFADSYNLNQPSENIYELEIADSEDLQTDFNK